MSLLLLDRTCSLTALFICMYLGLSRGREETFMSLLTSFLLPKQSISTNLPSHQASEKLGLSVGAVNGAWVPAEKVAPEAAPLPPLQPLRDLPAGHRPLLFSQQPVLKLNQNDLRQQMSSDWNGLKTDATDFSLCYPLVFISTLVLRAA